MYGSLPLDGSQYRYDSSVVPAISGKRHGEARRLPVNNLNQLMGCKMIKKIVIGIVTIIAFSAITVVGYIFSIKAVRPATSTEPVSVLHNEAYKSNAVRAEQWLEAAYKTYLFPSISISVGAQGALVWEAAIGYAELDGHARGSIHAI